MQNKPKDFDNSPCVCIADLQLEVGIDLEDMSREDVRGDADNIVSRIPSVLVFCINDNTWRFRSIIRVPSLSSNSLSLYALGQCDAMRSIYFLSAFYGDRDD